MNYYEILNVVETASQEEIKAAFRRLAMKHHPDKNAGNKASEETFKKVNEAYMTLSDTRRRSEYDYGLKFKKTSTSQNQKWDSYGSNGPFNSESFDDIFNYFRENQNKKNSQSHAYDFKKKPSSIPTVSLSLKFWEAAFGCVKKIKIPAKIMPGGVFANLNIEPGIDSGTKLQVTIKNKIFYVKVTVKEDKFFKRDGLNLYTSFDIPLTTAILGGSVIFPHWTRDVEVTIPPENSQGQSFRLRQMGLAKNGVKGDLYLSMNIVTPQKLTKRQRELMEEFQKLEKHKESNSYKNLQKLWQTTKN